MRYNWACSAIDSSCPQTSKILLMLSQRTAIGNEVRISKRIVLCNEMPRSQEGEFFSTKGLAANGLHAHGQARQDRVPGDVSEGQGEGPTGQGEVAEAAEEKHGDHGPGVE